MARRNDGALHLTGALMPDAHAGYGLPIGGVLATDNVVIPYAVGRHRAMDCPKPVLHLSQTEKLPFSPGTTSDDRINHQYWEDIQRIENLVHTEKLDGENLYATHSIEYRRLETHFYVFAE